PAPQLHRARRVSVGGRNRIGAGSRDLRQRRLPGRARHRVDAEPVRRTPRRASSRAREGSAWPTARHRRRRLCNAHWARAPRGGAVWRVDPGGGVPLATGASPQGRGPATILAQVVADELGIRPHEVAVRHGDPALIPFGVGTYASRNAVVAGSAALIAARIVAA